MGDTIRVTEKFLSIQGEGKFVGTPSVFVRFFNCNLQCRGFGQPRGELIPAKDMPHNTFDISSISSVEDLPVFDIGCDSSASWSKKYRHLTEESTVRGLIDDCSTLLEETTKRSVPHLVVTGGEPLLLRNQKFLMDFIELSPFTHVTIETNGTQLMTKEFKQKMLNLMSSKELNLTFSVSPKLSISGEKFSKAIVPEVIKQYVELFEVPCAKNKGEVYLKFVIRDELCIPEVEKAIEVYNFKKDVYLMSEGATDKGLDELKVSNLCVKHNYKFSPRLHINLYGNSWGT